MYSRISFSLTTLIAFSVGAFLSAYAVGSAFAQTASTTTTDASSTIATPVTIATTTDTGTTSPLISTPPVTKAAVQEVIVPDAPTSTTTPIPQTLVHKIGTRYIDYFTDGKKRYSFPGDPAIDANFDKPNAPIPSHTDMTWVSSNGMDAYDTPSGDLELNSYAQQDDGSYIVHLPSKTYTDATSTSNWPDRTVITKTDPSLSSIN